MFKVGNMNLRFQKVLNTLKKSFKLMLMNKKAQLGPIEAKFFLFGLITGLIIIFVVIALMNSGVIPFKLPMVNC